MLVSMKEMLADAQKNHYALPAFDISNYEMMRAVLDTCEDEHSPALLMALDPDLKGKAMKLIASMVSAASGYYDIPVCLHYDHATDFDAICRAIDAGFSSVMFDGSMLPLEENIEKTAKVTEYAHKAGITVEAELGHVGNGFMGNLATAADDISNEDTLTVPKEVAMFAAQTNVDALAISIGTQHGIYKRTPALRIDRLDEIAAVCSCPLVLHGGSETPEDQMRTAIAHGITKVNFFSDVLLAMNGGLKDTLNTMENPATWPAYVFEKARTDMRAVISNKLRTFGSCARV